MKLLTKTLLAASVISFAVSLTEPGIEVWYGTLKPVGALLFVMAFIVHIVAGLDPEQFAADQELRNELMEEHSPVETVCIGVRENLAA
jgi:hypothetical protein